MNLVAKLSLLLAFALPAGAVFSQSAADYPNRTVKLIVAYPPGGPVDAIARALGSSLEARFKQPFIVENRPGASSQLATGAVVKSPPDGYTLLVGALQVVLEQVMNKEWPYPMEKDLTSISTLASTGVAITVSNKAPAANLRELIAYSRANPGKLNEGVPGGVNPDLAIVERALGVSSVEYIMFAGAAPAVAAIASGDIDYTGVAVLPVMQLEKAGKLRIFAYTGKQRHPLIPHVPTLKEAVGGNTDFDAILWMALFGPAGMAPDLVNKLNAAATEAMKTPEVAAKVSAMGLLPETSTPAQAQAQLLDLLKRYHAAAAAGIKLR